MLDHKRPRDPRSDTETPPPPASGEAVSISEHLFFLLVLRINVCREYVQGYLQVV